MVGPKSTLTRLVGIITDEMHPYTYFVETPGFLCNMCRDAYLYLLYPVVKIVR